MSPALFDMLSVTGRSVHSYSYLPDMTVKGEEVEYRAKDNFITRKKQKIYSILRPCKK